jgi:hypothetical protein
LGYNKEDLGKYLFNPFYKLSLADFFPVFLKGGENAKQLKQDLIISLQVHFPDTKNPATSDAVVVCKSTWTTVNGATASAANMDVDDNRRKLLLLLLLLRMLHVGDVGGGKGGGGRRGDSV